MSFALAYQSKSNSRDGNILSSKHTSSGPHHINNLNRNSPEYILHLQRTIGDQGVQRLMHSNNNAKGFDFARIEIQPKLSVSQPHDTYEQEADRVAEQVMRMPVSAPSVASTAPKEERLYRKCAACEMKKEDEKLNISRKPSISSGVETTDEITNEISNVRSSDGKTLDTSTLEFMEPRFGHDFSNVKIHTDEIATQSANSVNALAYTVGNDIVFGQGLYEPNTLEGRKLLAHELTHVIQQAPSHEPNFSKSIPTTTISNTNLIQRQASMMDPDCEDLLAQIIARLVELKERADALIRNPLNLPPTGPMSVGGHTQQFQNKQTNLRNMLNQWNTNSCGPGLPVDVWFWATRLAPLPAPPTTTSPRIETIRDGSQITTGDVAKVAAGAAITVGTGYVIYRAVRMLPSLLPPLWWTIPANVAVP